MTPFLFAVGVSIGFMVLGRALKGRADHVSVKICYLGSTLILLVALAKGGYVVMASIGHIFFGF